MNTNPEQKPAESPAATPAENPAKTSNFYNLIILDESGSMQAIRSQALSGANETIQTIRAAQERYPEQNHRLTFVTFDTRNRGNLQDNVRTIINDLPINQVEPLTESQYCPCGCTPLYDAMGVSLSALETKVGPQDNVLVTIITDGYENASHEYTSQSIKTIVKLLTQKGWTFTYIGANQDAIEVAGGMGIDNAMNYEASAQGTKKMFCMESQSRMAYYRACSMKLKPKKGTFFDK